MRKWGNRRVVGIELEGMGLDLGGSRVEETDVTLCDTVTVVGLKGRREREWRHPRNDRLERKHCEERRRLTLPSSSAMNLISLVQVIFERISGEEGSSVVDKGLRRNLNPTDLLLPNPIIRRDPMATQHLASLLAPPSIEDARTSAQSYLRTSVSSRSTPSSTSRSPRQLGQLLSTLLEEQRTSQQELERRVQESEAKKGELLNEATREVSLVRSRTDNLKRSNEKLRYDAKEIKGQLERDLNQVVEGEEEDTLRDRLKYLATRRQQLQGAKQWFGIIVKAEELG